jgi:hypothetical protein
MNDMERLVEIADEGSVTVAATGVAIGCCRVTATIGGRKVTGQFSINNVGLYSITIEQDVKYCSDIDALRAHVEVAK